MLFDKRPRSEGFNWTDRKIKILEGRSKRLHKKLQEQYPLLADQIEAPVTITIEDELSRRQIMATQVEQEWRDRVAKLWRKVRGDYFACPREMRTEIRAYWQIWRGPRTAFNFGYVVESFNGVSEAKRLKFKENERAMFERIQARLTSQTQLPLSN